MTKFGKLEASDDSDDDTVKRTRYKPTLGVSSERRSEKYKRVISDDEDDDSELSTAPSTPVPRREPVKKASLQPRLDSRARGNMVSPIKTPGSSLPPVTPSPQRTSPLKARLQYSPATPGSGSPAKHSVSYTTPKRPERESSPASHTQDLVAALAAANSPDQFTPSRNLSSSRSSDKKKSSTSKSSLPKTPLSPSKGGALIVRLKRPNGAQSALPDLIPSPSPSALGSLVKETDPFLSAPIRVTSFALGDMSTTPDPSRDTSARYDSRVSTSFQAEWTSLARMRATLANSQFVPESKDDAIIISDSESGAEKPITLASVIAGSSQEVDRMEEDTDRHDGLGDSPLSPESQGPLGMESNLSVALKMRHYMGKVWNVATSVWSGTSTTSTPATQHTQPDHSPPNTVTSTEEDAMDPTTPDGGDVVDTTTQQRRASATSHRSLGNHPTPATPTSRKNSTVMATPNTVTSITPTFVNSQSTPNTKQLAVVSTSSGSVPMVALPFDGLDYTADYTADDFAYDSSSMRIDTVENDALSDDLFFAQLKDRPPPPFSIGTSDAGSFALSLFPHRPTWRFNGIRVPRVGGLPKTRANSSSSSRDSSPTSGIDRPLNWDDISDSDLSGSALDSFLAIKYGQELDAESSQGARKRKADRSTPSSFEGDTDEEYRRITKSAHRKSSKRRKLSDGSFDVWPSSQPRLPRAPRATVRQAMAGGLVDVAYGLCVDDIDTGNIRIRPARDTLVSTTRICHQCRNSSTTEMVRIQCGNRSAFSDGTESRCNKTFCERCLRAWYGLDDPGMKFLKTKLTQEDGSFGSGIGLGIVDGEWICPVCIALCMCTVCSRKRQVEREKYRPSINAVIASPIEQRPARPRQPTQTSGYSSTNTASSSRLVSGRAVPHTPAGWLPQIPTPTPGLDSVYYEATRPCTRDFPTGAPLPTAANHAPTLFQAGRELEDDGLEDSFTGSEAGDGDESDGPDLNGGKRRARTQGGTGDVTSAISATPTVRRNFIVVAPGEKLPSTTKKKHPLAIKQASASSPSTPLTSVLPVPNQADEREDNPAPFDSMDTPLSSVSTVNPNDLFQDSRPYKDNTNTTDHTMANLSQAAGPSTSSVNQPMRGPTSPPVTRDDLALDVGRMTQFLTPVFDDPLSSGGGLRDKSTALDNLGEFRSDESFHGPADGLSQHSHWLSFGEPNPLMETGDPLLFTDPMSSEGLLSTSLDQELPGDGSSHSYEADPAPTLPSSDPSVMDASQALDVSTFLHPWV